MSTASIPSLSSNSQYLTNEFLLQTFSQLEASDLKSAALVCKRWYKVSNDNLIWFKHCQKINALKESAIYEENCDYKFLFNRHQYTLKYPFNYDVLRKFSYGFYIELHKDKEMRLPSKIGCGAVATVFLPIIFPLLAGGVLYGRIKHARAEGKCLCKSCKKIRKYLKNNPMRYRKMS